MKLRAQKSLLQHAIRQRNGYLAIVCGSLLLNLVLGLGLISTIGREKIVIVPPKVTQSFWVNSSLVSSEYLAEMSHFFVMLRFNVAPATAKEQQEMLLRYVGPEYYESLKIQLLNEAESMMKDRISNAFYPVDIKIDARSLEALVIGDLVSTVGTNKTPTKRVTYKISYKYNNHRLLVKQFTEVLAEDKQDA